MTGKTVAITGCTSGTGLILARTCGSLGARVIMLNRASERADAALRTLRDALPAASADKVTLVPCDLQSFASVRHAATVLREICPDGIDVLCNNAGVMGLPDLATGDGFDVQMQSNHLSHFLLTSQVWQLLERAARERGEARVVNHSSGARKAPLKPLTAEYLQRNGGNLGGDGFPGMAKWQRYQQSKLANLLFTYELDSRRRTNSKVKVLCAHPGPCDTGLQGKTSTAGGDRYLDRYILARTLNVAQSGEDGTMGIAICCCAANVKSGEFYGPERQGLGGPAVLLPPERNFSEENLLWALSLEACGLTDFFTST